MVTDFNFVGAWHGIGCHIHQANSCTAITCENTCETESEGQVAVKPHGLVAMIKNCFPKIFQTKGMLRYREIRVFGTGLEFTIV